MENLYDWQSHLLASAREDKDFSLWDLLDIIPTDIPKDASEFDEELRNIIIDLYSDKSMTWSEGNEKTVKSKSNNICNIESPNEPPLKIQETQENRAFNNEASAESNFDLDKQPSHLNPNIIGNESIQSNGECNGPTLKTSSQSDISPNETFFENEGEIVYEMEDDSLISDIQNHAEERNNSTKSELGTESTDRMLSAMAKEDLPTDKNGFETYQRSLDDLGDGQTAQLLTSITDWISKISSDTPKDLFANVSLSDNLPNCAFLDVHDKGVGMGESIDHISLPNMPSAPLEAENLIKTHNLAVITEENDTMLNQEVEIKEEVDRLESSQSSFDLGSSTHDSGIGSITILSHTQDKSTDALEPKGFEIAAVMGKRFQRETDECHFKSGSETNADAFHAADEQEFLAGLEEKLDTFAEKEPHIQIAPLLSVEGHMDSQIQTLSRDYATLMKEKMSLKKIIWNLEEDLSTERKLAEIKDEEKSTVQEQKSQIEAVVLDLEEKLANFESESKRRDVALQETMKKLQMMTQEYDELKSKAATSEEQFQQQNEDLEKTKAELRKSISEANTANEDKGKYESQLKMISEAFQKLKQNKEWLEFQLKTLSDSRAKMQLQFEEARIERNKKAIALSEVQAENKKLSAKLAELNFASVGEKAEIVKQMEKVENEIKEHDLLYARLEKENEAFCLLVNERNEIIANNEAKIRELIELVENAEEKVEKLTREVADKESTFKCMKSEMESAKSKMEEYNGLVKNLEAKSSNASGRVTGLEQEILNLQEKVEASKADVCLLNAEKGELEKSLEAANVEKAEFENAALALKADMQKVNLIFHIMKKDLASKSSLLQTIDAKKMELISEMRDLQDYMTEQGQVQDELRDTLKTKIDTIRFLSDEKESLEAEVGQLNKKSKRLQDSLEKVTHAKERLEKQSEELHSDWHKQKQEFETKICELTKECETMTASNAESGARVVELRRENDSLAENFERVKKENQVDIANLRAKENKLMTQLREKQNEWLKREESYECSVMSLVERLKEESIKVQQMAATCAAQQKLVDKKERGRVLMAEKTKEFIHTIGLLKEEKDLVCKELLKLKASIPKMFSFLESAVDRMSSHIKEGNDKNANLMEMVGNLRSEVAKSENRTILMGRQLQMEKEKTLSLENDIETQRGELKDSRKQILVLKKDKDVAILKFGQYKKSAEEKCSYFDKEKDGLVCQVKKLEEESVMLHAELKQREDDLKRMTREKAKHTRKLSEVEKSYGETLLAKNEAVAKGSKVTSAYEELQGVVFGLENQLGIERSQTRVLKDQMDSLKWQFKQATAEAQAKNKEMDALRAQHESELRNISSLLEVTKTELSCLRDEVSETRKEKQKCNGLLIEARERLRRQTNDFEKLRKDILKRNEDLVRLKEDMSGCKSTAAREMLDFIVKKAVIRLPNVVVLEDDSKRGPSAALVTLRKCMSVLRVEMDTLHMEMSSQQECLKGSRSKLTEFQENLGYLQSACQSLHQKSMQPCQSENPS